MMISCFKGSATKDWKTDFENTHAASYISTLDLAEEGPKISKIVDSLKQYDVFKYSAYRTAFKLQAIQKASKLYLVDLSIIESILKEYNFDSQCQDQTVTANITADFISALYNEINKKIGFTEDPNTMTNLFCALLQNTFVEEENPLLSVQMKITLTLFSAANLSEKHKYIFYHCASNGVMSKKGLELLLKTLSKLAEIVGEQVTFGSHLVSTAVQNCLRYCKGKITEKRFRKWLSLEPQTLVWLSTLHRIAISEKTEHSVCCEFCQINPMIGLRYKCLQCISYNLCQSCFLRGLYNKSHKEGHFMQEFCQPASVWQETKATFNAVRNKLPFGRCQNKAYLSFDEESLCDSSGSNHCDSIRNSSVKNCTLKKSTASYLIKELTSIITTLDNERKQIAAIQSIKNDVLEQDKMLKISDESTSNKSLQERDLNLNFQLNRLRELLKCLKIPDPPKKETGIVSPVPHIPFHKKDQYFESTPLNSSAFPFQIKENNSKFQSKNQHLKNMHVNSDCFPLQSKENHEFSVQSVQNSKSSSEKQRNHSLFLSNHPIFNPSDKENFALSSSYNISSDQCPSMSLELTNLLNESSPKNLSGKLSKLNEDISKFNPLYGYSTTDLEEPVFIKSAQFSSHAVSDSSLGLLPSKVYQSTFTLNKDGSLEIMEQELQAMLHQLEELLPQVSFLANDSRVEKEKVINALSEMEEAVHKLSHLSIELSTGSTDL